MIDPKHARVQWQHRGFSNTTSMAYTGPQVTVVLHEIVLRTRRTFDWHGFAADLVNSNKQTVQLARSKTMEGVTQYANDFHDLTGIEVK